MGKKGQAAIEYLHTYGFVILIIMVVGGLIVYHSIGSTEKILPEECSFLSGLRCMDMQVDETLLSIEMINENSYAMSNLSLMITGTCNSTANTSEPNPYENPHTIMPTKQARMTFECQNLSRQPVSEQIVITYVNSESGKAHTKLGKMTFSPGKG